MYTLDELTEMANSKLEDAKALYDAGRFDGAIYMTGYAIELWLKACICKTLNWQGFPEKNGEFSRSKSKLKTHDLIALREFSGIEEKINREYKAEWSTVVNWSPERRYSRNLLKSSEEQSKLEAATIIDAAKTLLKVYINES